MSTLSSQMHRRFGVVVVLIITSSMTGCAQSRGTLASRLWGPDRVTLKQAAGKMVSFVTPGKKDSKKDSQLANDSSEDTGRVSIASLDVSANSQAVRKGNVLNTLVSNHPGKSGSSRDPFLDEDNRLAAAGGTGEENSRINPFTGEKISGSQPGFATSFDGQMARLRASMRNETMVANAFPSHPGPTQMAGPTQMGQSRPPVIVAGPVAGRRESRYRQLVSGTTGTWPAYDYRQNDRSRKIAERDRRWYPSTTHQSLAHNNSNLPPTWMPVDPMTPSHMIRPAGGYAASTHSAVRSQYEMIIDNELVPTREETRRLNSAPQSITYPELHPSNRQNSIRLMHGNVNNSRGVILPTGANRSHRDPWNSGNVTVTGFSQIREADGMRSTNRPGSEVGMSQLVPRMLAHEHTHDHAHATVADDHAHVDHKDHVHVGHESVIAAHFDTGHSESLTPPLMTVPRNVESGSESVSMRWLVFILAGIGSAAVIVLGLRRRSQIRI